jgi:putative flippase GtrA
MSGCWIVFMSRIFELLRRFLPDGVPEFLVVGGIGFIVDALILMTLIHLLDMNPYLARVFSFSGAVTVTWLLNRIWTFSRTMTVKKGSEYTRYIMVQTCGWLINFSVYAFCLTISTIMIAFPVLALAVGSLTAATFNFLGARHFVFTGNKQTPSTIEGSGQE